MGNKHKARFLNLSRTAFGVDHSLLWGFVLCLVGYLVESLASVLYMLVVPLLPSSKIKHFSRQ